MTPPDIFAGPHKRAILHHLAARYPDAMTSKDLCRAVYGDAEKPHRDSLRNLVQVMRPRLEAAGWTIDGRDVLKAHAYRLRCTVL